MTAEKPAAHVAAVVGCAMSKKLCFGALLSVFGAGLFLVAQPAWAVNTIPATCTASGPAPPAGLPGCLTDPAFPNTWFVPAQFPGTPGENEPVSEQTMTLTFPGKTFTSVGVFNILDPAGERGGISDQIQLVHTAGVDQLIFSGDPFTPLPGGTTLATEGANGANGAVASFPIGFVGGGGITATVGSDQEIPFNPIGIGGGQDLSDFVQLTPEPSTIALLASGLVGLGFMRTKKQGICQTDSGARVV